MDRTPVEFRAPRAQKFPCACRDCKKTARAHQRLKGLYCESGDTSKKLRT